MTKLSKSQHATLAYLAAKSPADTAAPVRDWPVPSAANHMPVTVLSLVGLGYAQKQIHADWKRAYMHARITDAGRAALAEFNEKHGRSAHED